MRLNLLLVLLVLANSVRATHIIGGNMYYDHLGGNDYLITLVLYRDCGPDNTNGTGFDAQAQLAVYTAGGALFTSVAVDYTGELPVPVVLTDPCLTAPPTVCVRTAIYQANVVLPPVAGGYNIAYQRCCRTPAMVNLAGLQGLTCTASIPGPEVLPNSSPRFDDLPAVALCLGQDMVLDFAASDPDGDQLQYELCAPFLGATDFDPMPFPAPPPYAPVNYSGGYSASAPLNSAPPITIDPATGQISVHPTLQGVFTVGVCVTELRNGVAIGVTRGDFLFKVVVCDAQVESVIADQDLSQLCVGLQQSFSNLSDNATSWFWDFGDTSTSADTSSLAEPQWTYAEPGSYTVTLIANPGLYCADTSIAVYDVFPILDIGFERPAIRCPGEAATLEVSGVYPADATFTWDFGATASPAFANGVTVQTAYTEVGVFPVTVSAISNGCTDSFTDSVVVFPRPVISFLNETTACVGEALAFSSLSTAWTPLSLNWDLGDGTASTDSSFMHTYSDPGVYTVALTIATDSGCVAEETMVRLHEIVIHPKPTAAFTALPSEVSLMDPKVEVTDYADLAVEWSYTVEGNDYDAPSFAHEFQDGGQFTLTQTVTTEHGCTDSTTRVVIVSDHLIYVPNAFTPNGDNVNDTWVPSVRGARLYELVVFDRWGKEVFRTQDPKATWSGDGLAEGVYNYTIRLAEYGTFRKEYTGHVSLLR